LIQLSYTTIIHLKWYYAILKGQKIGTQTIKIIIISTVRKDPILKKSINLYFPGPYTRIQEGSKGVINDTEADSIMAMAKVRGLVPNS
jgi:hypothetical protein